MVILPELHWVILPSLWFTICTVIHWCASRYHYSNWVLSDTAIKDTEAPKLLLMAVPSMCEWVGDTLQWFLCLKVCVNGWNWLNTSYKTGYFQSVSAKCVDGQQMSISDSSDIAKETWKDFTVQYQRDLTQSEQIFSQTHYFLQFQSMWPTKAPFAPEGFLQFL